MYQEFIREEMIEIYSDAINNIVGAGIAGCESGGFGFFVEA